MPHVEQWKQALGEHAKVTKDFAIAYLKRPKMRCQEGEGRKSIAVSVVTLNSADFRPIFYPGCVKIGYQV